MRVSQWVAPPGSPHVLYNLDILRRCLPDAAVDLVYLDPPNATDAHLLALRRQQSD